MPNITKEEILSLLVQNKSELENRFKVRRLALFGSYARGDQKPDSDVDILVDIDPSVGLEFVTSAEKNEQLLGLPIELIIKFALLNKYRSPSHFFAFIEKTILNSIPAWDLIGFHSIIIIL